MIPAHRAKQVAIYHELEFKRDIKQLLRKRRLHIADKKFDYDGESVHTQFVIPNCDADRHLGLICNEAIEQVGSLHPFYRSLSMKCCSFGASHTRMEIKVRLQNDKVGVLSKLAGFLVCLGWEMAPHIPNDNSFLKSPDQLRSSSPHCIHLFDLKTHRSRLSRHVCTFVASGAWRVLSMSVETGQHHVHVNVTACVAD